MKVYKKNKASIESIFDFAGCLADTLTPDQVKRELDALRDQDNND